MNTQELAEKHLHQAIAVIDAKLGKDYAKAHPELVGAYLQAEMGVLSTILLIQSSQRIAPPPQPLKTETRVSTREQRSRSQSRELTRPR